MANMQDIRKYMGIWKQMTYRKGLDYCYAIKNDSKLFDLCVEVVKEQKLTDKNMDGNSVQNIPFIKEDKTKVIFTDIFWELAGNYITPAFYIASIVNECVKKGIESKEEITKTVGRGLRAFPSFLREMDLTYKISSLIPGADVINGPEQDVGEHTDILIRSHGTDYRLWSYQNTDRGLTNTAQRFYGKRGEIPQGLHVLCPIDIGNESEVEKVDGWCFYSDKYVHFLVEMMEIEKPDRYAELKRLEEYALKIYLKKANLVLRGEL